MQANGIELEYEVFGDGDPLVLIMGIGAQMINWPEGLIDELVSRGFQVIRFDNRDVGLSSKIDGARVPRINKLLARGLLGLPVRAPYTLSDMADDTAGLLDGLGIDRAHIVGASMGGMIAQTMAIVHPSRVRTLTSIMSNTGDRWPFVAHPRAIKSLLGKAPRNKEEAVEHFMNFKRVCGSTGFPFDEQEVRDLAARAYERCFYPLGFVRQMAAIAATGDRTGALRFVRTPTLVLHGSADPLIRPAGGRATARAIPNAKLQIIEGMGHDLPRGAWPIISDAIAAHAEQARKREADVSPLRTFTANA